MEFEGQNGNEFGVVEVWRSTKANVWQESLLEFFERIVELHSVGQCLLEVLEAQTSLAISIQGSKDSIAARILSAVMTGKKGGCGLFEVAVLTVEL
jgi:hypothetical protein